MIRWVLKKFEELSPAELYTILLLRSEVFVVEQQCIFLDMDNKDQHCFHLCGRDNETLVAYTRIVPPGISYTEPSIGRVVTAPSYRAKGAGKLLMEKSIDHVQELYGSIPIRIGAQLYLKKFYENLGFAQSGSIYDEDGIDHIEMVLKQPFRKFP